MFTYQSISLLFLNFWLLLKSLFSYLHNLLSSNLQINADFKKELTYRGKLFSTCIMWQGHNYRTLPQLPHFVNFYLRSTHHLSIVYLSEIYRGFYEVLLEKVKYYNHKSHSQCIWFSCTHKLHQFSIIYAKCGWWVQSR